MIIVKMETRFLGTEFTSLNLPKFILVSQVTRIIVVGFVPAIYLVKRPAVSTAEGGKLIFSRVFEK